MHRGIALYCIISLIWSRYGVIPHCHLVPKLRQLVYLGVYPLTLGTVQAPCVSFDNALDHSGLGRMPRFEKRRFDEEHLSQAGK